MSANDNSASRPIYQTRGGASSECLSLAVAASPSRRARCLEFLPAILTPDEGGEGYEVELLIEGWGVKAVSVAEQRRRQQSALRIEVEQLYSVAADEAELASAATSPTFEAMHLHRAKKALARAREIETLLTVSVARAV